jgi:hypothetical protein
METTKPQKALNRLKTINVISEEFIVNIPENSTLVVGASVGENKTGRDFYNDPTFYLLGLDINPTAIDGRNRFIASDLNDSNNMTSLTLAFNQKFKTVIIDVEVIKFIQGNFSMIVGILCNMIVPDGKLIFLKGHEATQNFITKHNTPDYITQNKLTKSEIHATIKVESITTTMDENPAAKRVYSAIVLDENLSFIKKDDKCVIITISNSDNVEIKTDETNETIKSDIIQIGDRQDAQPLKWWGKNPKKGGKNRRSTKRKSKRKSKKRKPNIVRL